MILSLFTFILQGTEFLRNFHSTYQNDLADVWDEVQHGPLPPLDADTRVGTVSGPPLPPTLRGNDLALLSSTNDARLVIQFYFLSE